MVKTSATWPLGKLFALLSSLHFLLRYFPNPDKFKECLYSCFKYFLGLSAGTNVFTKKTKTKNKRQRY